MRRSIAERLQAQLAILVLSIAAAVVNDSAASPLEVGTQINRLFFDVVSIHEIKYRTTIKQKYDFSCGSAALATLLTYHYENPVSEAEVFKWMYENGDKQAIRKAGFSMMDMKKYLESIGFKSDGFRFGLDILIKLGVPAVALISEDGYKHFVVIKGVVGGHVVVGDPATGMHTLREGDFLRKWNGIMFVISSHRDRGALYFNREDEISRVGLLADDGPPFGDALNAQAILHLPSAHLPLGMGVEF
ncbi:MAG: C39 family peptidase [Pseudomonadota bacterium]